MTELELLEYAGWDPLRARLAVLVLDTAQRGELEGRALTDRDVEVLARVALELVPRVKVGSRSRMRDRLHESRNGRNRTGGLF